MKDRTWNRIQFIHLIITVIIGCFITWNSISLSKKVNEAEYNDKSWLALNEYEDKQKEINDHIKKLLDEQFEGNVFYTEWLKKSNDLLVQWKDKSLNNQQRLKTKLDSYENVAGITFSAKQRATVTILNNHSPFSKTLGQIEGIIKTRDTIARESSKKSRAAGYINSGTRKIKLMRESFLESIVKANKELSSEWVNKT